MVAVAVVVAVVVKRETRERVTTGWCCFDDLSKINYVGFDVLSIFEVEPSGYVHKYSSGRNVSGKTTMEYAML